VIPFGMETGGTCLVFSVTLISFVIPCDRRTDGTF